MPSLSDIWGTIEKHPLLTGGIVFGVGAVIVYFAFSGSGSSGSSGGADLSSYYGAQATAAVSGNQLQAEQIAAQVQTNAVQQQYGTEFQIAQLQNNTQQDAIATQGAIQLAGVNATNLQTQTAGAVAVSGQQLGAQTQQLVSTLGANVAGEQVALASQQTEANRELQLYALESAQANVDTLSNLLESVRGAPQTIPAPPYQTPEPSLAPYPVAGIYQPLQPTSSATVIR